MTTNETHYTACTDYTVLTVSGPDAESFLQGQISCDMTKVSEARYLFGVYCNIKGRVVSFFRCFKSGEHYGLLLHRSLADITHEMLDKYARFSNVTIEEPELFIYGMVNAKPELGWFEIQCADDILRLGAGDDPNRHWLITSEPVTFPEDYEAIDINDWEYLEMLSGIPIVTSGVSGEFIPQRLNMQSIQALDFEKGCYLGQEIVARMHFRGSLKHHLYRVELKLDEAPDDDVEVVFPLELKADGKVIGQVIYAIPLARTLCHAQVVMLADEAYDRFIEIGEQLHVTAHLEILPIPYTWGEND